MRAACHDEEFIALCRTHRSAAIIARTLGVTPRSILSRRDAIEGRYKIKLPFDRGDKRPNEIKEAETALKAQLIGLKPPKQKPKFAVTPHDWRYLMRISDGQIVIGSDAHYKPNNVSTAHRAFVHIVKRLKPLAVVMNGDIFDGASVSRHFRIRWHEMPNVKQEIEAVQDRLAEIEKVAGNAKLIRTWGNHDSNFETRLSGLVPQYEGVAGFSLRDHLPRWQPCMAIHVNDSLVIKHRYKGGVHATHNNTKDSGRSIVTGHLHSLKVTPWTDYNGTRYGVDSGTLATPEDDTFHYAEDDPRNWRSGFVVLTFVDGVLMPPDVCQVIRKDAAYFRGEIIEV